MKFIHEISRTEIAVRDFRAAIHTGLLGSISDPSNFFGTVLSFFDTVFFVVFSVIMLLTVWAFKISIFLTKISDISQTTVGFSHSKILSFGPYPVHSGPYKLSHVTLDR